MKPCKRCKIVQEDSVFAGRAICPTCYDKQTSGLRKSKEVLAAKAEENKQMDAALLKTEEPKMEVLPPGSRKKRTPMNGRAVLDYKDKDPQYEYRVFNDTVGRLERAEEAGWEYVKSANPNALADNSVENRRGLGAVVSRPVGRGLTGFLMRKQKDEFAEDYAIIEQNAQRVERSILHADKDNPSFYQKPGQEIKIDTIHSRMVKPIQG